MHQNTICFGNHLRQGSYEIPIFGNLHVWKTRINLCFDYCTPNSLTSQRVLDQTISQKIWVVNYPVIQPKLWPLSMYVLSLSCEASAEGLEQVRTAKQFCGLGKIESRLIESEIVIHDSSPTFSIINSYANTEGFSIWHQIALLIACLSKR